MKLAIIGAGPAGIISAYNAAQNNIEVVLFEKLANVGGIWNPDSGGAYYHTKMQNSKYTFYFSEIPSESKNNFLSVKDVHSYLSNIPLGKNKNIAIRLNTSINNLKKTPEGWLLTLQCGTHITTEIFDKVIVTIGELWNP
ncbi:NAD(P)-binding protein, partial [Rodentibacter ratti]